MRINIVSIFLIFFMVINIHAGGMFDLQTEAQRREELEQYPIKVAPISLPGTASYNFVFIDDDKIILLKPLQLIEVNLTTNEQKEIILPEECTADVFMGFRDPIYDEKSNSVHINFRWLYRELNPIRRQSYYILHLDDYSWETIEELGNEILSFYYDTSLMLIYVLHRYATVNESGYNISTYITTYDFNRREIIDSVECPDGTYTVYLLYGNPVKILASTRSDQMEPGLYFFIYDLKSKTRIDFPESIFNMDTDFYSLSNYIPIDENERFLGVAHRVSNISSIAIMDLNTNTIETVALDGFPYVIYNLKQISEGKYAFMVGTRTWTGSHGPSFLCFLELSIKFD